MNTQTTQNKAKFWFWVESTENGDNFEERQAFKTFAEAQKFLWHFIYDQPMSLSILDHQNDNKVLKTYNYKQRVRVS